MCSERIGSFLEQVYPWVMVSLVISTLSETHSYSMEQERRRKVLESWFCLGQSDL